MNYIAVALQSYLQETETTIGIFIGMISSKKLKGLFTGNVPEYHLQSFVLKQIIKWALPNLHAHLGRVKFNLEMILCNWLMTLFCGFFLYATPSLIVQILDNFFLDGWPAIYRISVALLRILEPKLLCLDDTEEI